MLFSSEHNPQLSLFEITGDVVEIHANSLMFPIGQFVVPKASEPIRHSGACTGNLERSKGCAEEVTR